MRAILNFILSPLFKLGIIPKLAPTGIYQAPEVHIGERSTDE